MYLISTSLVGVFLLLTAVLKAFYSRLFIIHVKRYQIIPGGPSSLAALLFVEFEAGLGVALVLEIYPQVLVPVVFCLVTFFSLLSWWGYKYKKLDECGCYGGVIRLKQWHSQVVNLVILLVLGFTWFNYSFTKETTSQSLYILIAVILAFHLISKKTVRRPLFDFLRLKTGKLWNSRLFDLNSIDIDQQNVLFIILESNCSLCRSWIQHMSELETGELQVSVIGLLSQKSKETYQNKEISVLRFPVFTIKNWMARLLGGRLPMAVRVVDGIISDVRSGTFPEEIFF